MVWGIKAKRFFNYIISKKININTMDGDMIKFVAKETGLSVNYIWILKKRYRSDG